MWVSFAAGVSNLFKDGAVSTIYYYKIKFENCLENKSPVPIIPGYYYSHETMMALIDVHVHEFNPIYGKFSH